MTSLTKKDKLGGFKIEKLEKIEFSILKTEEKLESFQEKLSSLKKQKIEVENATKLKMLNENNIDCRQLQDILGMFVTPTNNTENNTEKENEIENN